MTVYGFGTIYNWNLILKHILTSVNSWSGVCVCVPGKGCVWEGRRSNRDCPLLSGGENERVRHRPERTEPIWESYSMLLCKCVCVYEREASVKSEKVLMWMIRWPIPSVLCIHCAGLCWNISMLSLLSLSLRPLSYWPLSVDPWRLVSHSVVGFYKVTTANILLLVFSFFIPVYPAIKAHWTVLKINHVLYLSFYWLSSGD